MMLEPNSEASMIELWITSLMTSESLSKIG